MVKKGKKQKKDKAYKISNIDKEKYYDYIIKFEKELSHFDYSWNDETLQKFLKEHDIKDTAQSAKYWICLIAGYKGKDDAFSNSLRMEML